VFRRWHAITREGTLEWADELHPFEDFAKELAGIFIAGLISWQLRAGQQLWVRNAAAISNDCDQVTSVRWRIVVFESGNPEFRVER